MTLEKKTKVWLAALLAAGLAGIVCAALFFLPGAERNGGEADIFLNTDSVAVSGSGVSVSGTTVTIKEAGDYRISGTLEDGQIRVEAGDKDEVRLHLGGVVLANEKDDAIHIKEAGSVRIRLDEGAENEVRSGQKPDGSVSGNGDEASGAAVFSKENLVLEGGGSLTVYGYINGGIKSKKDLQIMSGNYQIESTGDALHSNENLLIADGTFSLASGDDGMHADRQLTVKAGNIDITKSYEGIEGNEVYVEGGEIQIVSSDDGINAYGGQNEGRGGFGGSQKTTETKPKLVISGGVISVDASGDGLDSNGDLSIEGGTIRIDGPSDGGNGALDSGTENGGSLLVSGGSVIAVGSSGMAETFQEESKQCSFRYNHSEAVAAGTVITVQNEAGDVLFSHTAKREFSSVVFSSPDLKQGEKYTLLLGEEKVEIELSSMSVSAGAEGHAFGGRRPDGGEPPREKPDGEMPRGEKPEGEGGKARNYAIGGGGRLTKNTIPYKMILLYHKKDTWKFEKVI